MKKLNEAISIKQAKEDLGEDLFFKFLRWLRTKGYMNFTKVAENKYVQEIFTTKEQLKEFMDDNDVVRNDGGNQPITVLWGQTREHLKGSKIGKK